MSDLLHMQHSGDTEVDILLGFLQDSSLINITTGTAAGKEVTVDRAREIECKIFRNIEGQNVADHPLTCTEDVTQAFCYG